MLNFSSNKGIIRVYNGTNHDVSLYSIDCDHFKSNRNCSSFKLIDPQVQPCVTFEQRNVLDVKRIMPTPMDCYGISFSSPDYIYPVERFEGAENYDVIIVSRYYAENALKSNLPPEYIDRLYIVGTKVLDASGTLLGNAGLQKATNPFGIAYYISTFEHKQNPSIVSAKMCLQWYQSANVNADYTTQTALWKLERFIQAEESNRNSRRFSAPVFQEVFNV